MQSSLQKSLHRYLGSFLQTSAKLQLMPLNGYVTARILLSVFWSDTWHCGKQASGHVISHMRICGMHSRSGISTSLKSWETRSCPDSGTGGWKLKLVKAVPASRQSSRSVWKTGLSSRMQGRPPMRRLGEGQSGQLLERAGFPPHLSVLLSHDQAAVRRL